MLLSDMSSSYFEAYCIGIIDKNSTYLSSSYEIENMLNSFTINNFKSVEGTNIGATIIIILVLLTLWFVCSLITTEILKLCGNIIIDITKHCILARKDAMWNIIFFIIFLIFGKVEIVYWIFFTYFSLFLIIKVIQNIIALFDNVIKNKYILKQYIINNPTDIEQIQFLKRMNSVINWAFLENFVNLSINVVILLYMFYLY